MYDLLGGQICKNGEIEFGYACTACTTILMYCTYCEYVRTYVLMQSSVSLQHQVLSRNLTSVNITTNSFAVTWEAPANPNGVLTAYNVEISSGGRALQATNTSQTEFTFPGLDPVVNYTVSVCAYTLSCGSVATIPVETSGGVYLCGGSTYVHVHMYTVPTVHVCMETFVHTLKQHKIHMHVCVCMYILLPISCGTT